MKIVHTGDWHLDYEPIKLKKAERSLSQLVEYCSEVKINVLMIAGDVWDSKQKMPYYHSASNEGAGIALAHKYLVLLSELVDWVIITKGNNHHDPPESISILHHLDGRENILAYEQPVMIAFDDNGYADILRDENYHGNPYLIMPMIPYFTKEYLIQEKSIDESNADFNSIFDGLMTTIGIINDRYPSAKKVMGLHGNVRGMRLSNGQSLLGQDIIYSPNSLKLAKCDYYGLAHIHLPQEIENNMRYSGSLYNKNWGETEQKYFNVIRFEENDLMDVERLPLTAAKPMIEVKAEFKDGKIVMDNVETTDVVMDEGEIIDAEYRIKLNINEGDLSGLNQDMLDNLTDKFGKDVRIDKNIIPVERENRSEKIMDAKTLQEEVVEFGLVIGEEVGPTIIKKIQEIECDM